MPIVDFAELARKKEAMLFARPGISDKNKEVIRKFLKTYNVKPATKAKFLQNIVFFLERIELGKEMKDRDKINSIYADIRENISPGYFNTIVNVSKRLVTWLNDGQLPKSFRDVKKYARIKERRALKKQDMWEWEDGKKVGKATTSIQFKAIIATQLDAGFRPSEFHDLNYGSVTVLKDVVVFNVEDGKTGPRPVHCHRCVPAFLRWYEQHPTKRSEDPLWIKESTEGGNDVERYQYAAMVDRLQNTARKAGVNKPCDFYTLRHSSCRLDKIENVPVEIAAARHGHSVEYFTVIYGRLDENDVANRMRLHYGGKVEEVKLHTNAVCGRCGFANDHDARRCDKCGCALNLMVALEMEKQTSDAFKSLKEDVEKMKKALAKQAFQENLEKAS